jgi:hypothetical protein
MHQPPASTSHQEIARQDDHEQRQNVASKRLDPPQLPQFLGIEVEQVRWLDESDGATAADGVADGVGSA